MHSQFLSLRQLRFFVTLSETRNFSRAAEQMAVSQPALSSAIRQIETLVGLKLFERSTHYVNLTGAGASFLPHAQRLLVTAENAFEDIRDVAHHGRITVRIGSIPSAIPFVAKAIAEMEKANPGLILHLADAKSPDLIDDLRRGAHDIVICVSEPIDRGMVGTPLVEDDMLLVTPTDHPFSTVQQLPWRDLRGQEVIHFAGGSIGELSRAAMRQNGLSSASRYRVDQVDSLFGIVASGLALGIMPRLYTRGFAGDRFNLVRLVEPDVRRRLSLIHRRQLPDEHKMAANVADLLGALLRRDFRSGYSDMSS